MNCNYNIQLYIIIVLIDIKGMMCLCNDYAMSMLCLLNVHLIPLVFPCIIDVLLISINNVLVIEIMHV